MLPAGPLVDRLVVVADHGEAGAEAVQDGDEVLLDRVNVLILVDDQGLNAHSDPDPQSGVSLQRRHGLLEGGRVVEVSLRVQEGCVR
jgi:hypothetical protein